MAFLTTVEEYLQLAKKGQKLSKAHRAKLSAAAKKRHAANRTEKLQSTTRRHARKRMRNGRAPGGIHVLRRNGRGKDIVECNADMIINAVRAVREFQKIMRTIKIPEAD